MSHNFDFKQLFPFSRVASIGLPDERAVIEADTEVAVIGLGNVGPNQPPIVLQEVHLRTTDLEACRDTFLENNLTAIALTTTEETICAMGHESSTCEVGHQGNLVCG